MFVNGMGFGIMVRVGIFGSLLIPGICAMLSKKRLTLPKVVVIRDSIGFILFLALVITFLEDGIFYPMECLLFLCIFVVYLLFVFLSPLVRRRFHHDGNFNQFIDHASMTESFVYGGEEEELYCRRRNEYYNE